VSTGAWARPRSPQRFFLNAPKQKDGECYVLNSDYAILDTYCDSLLREIEHLKEVVLIPLITPDAPAGFYFRVLAEHEKGDPVNTQDLINALMWRVKNQREQLARLNQRISAMLAGGDCK